MSTPSSRIALICLHTSPLAEPGRADAGGMNVVVQRWSHQLADLGFTVDLFTRRAEPDSPRTREVRAGVWLHQLDAGPPGPLAKSDMEAAIKPFAVELRAAFSTRGPDLVHSHHWFSGVAALPIAQDLGVPHVQSFHSVAAPANAASLAAGETSESPGRIAGERYVAGASDLVIAVSRAEAATISERYDVDPARMRVVRPGVGTTFFHPRNDDPCLHGPDQRERNAADRDETGPRDSARSSRGEGSEAHRSGDGSPAPYLLFAARLQPLKGADLALEAFALITERRPRLRLAIAGAASDDFGNYPEELYARVEELGLTGRVDFLGAVSRSRLADLMRGAELFLLPSWSETFGLVALESQASGVPVIGWRGAGGLPEAVAPTGVLLTSREPAAWAQAVEAFLSDPARLCTARADARAFALTQSWQASGNALAAVYREVLS
ncbi:MAG: glycosyltransferase [Bowdeniella nasicola]|nr:glycosyltransferase [Bowdeniella nasicola]